jgi:hypothetical protein
VYAATPSMSPSTLNSFFSCASASGNCPIRLWYSDFKVEREFVQNDWYPDTGMSAIPTRHSVRSSQSLVCHSTNLIEVQCSPLATQSSVWTSNSDWIALVENPSFNCNVSFLTELIKLALLIFLNNHWTLWITQRTVRDFLAKSSVTHCLQSRLFSR